MKKRCSGILMPVSSLPGGYGIGSMGQAARDFVDFLVLAGQSVWQILPVGPTSYGDSPYQSCSAFAGNPYFIDLDLLAADGLLTKKDYAAINWGGDAAHVDYGTLYEKRFGIRYEISFSVQKPSTDTIAVNPDNTPFRQEDGSLLFRPAGHGALIENLNEIDADIIFIKNIDNVTTDARRGDTIRYKKVLAGLLLELQEQAFAHLRALEAGTADLAEVAAFVEQRLCVKLPAAYDAALLRAVLDRPIRVCGMVRNEGEPGGGPFWVANPDGTESLQIAESSQISPDDMPLMKSATHFNPVDLVCGVRTSQGGKFDLRRYTDPSTGFISSKSSGGRELRAQELPGLWNGAMARWNTVFVDVPITTFSPVKVVQDLLRPQHQQ